jgi:hypothetical protein
VSVTTGQASDSFIVKIIVGAVVLGIGIFLVSTVFGAVFTPGNFGSVALDNNGQATVNAPEDERIKVVRDTSGRAASFGGGGAVVIDSGIGFLNATGPNETGQATLLTHAAVDDPTRTQVLYQIGEEYQLSYSAANGGQYVVWYFDEQTRDTYSTSVAAASDPTDLTAIVIERDGETLTLSKETNGTLSASVQTTGDSFAELPTDTSLDGRLEETRVINRTLTSSEKSQYATDPIAPLAVGNRTSRLMFDTRGDGVAVDFRNASGSLTGDAGRGDGVAGEELVQGQDFSVTDPQQDTQTITALAGGQLENMPRVFLTAINDFTQLIQLVSTAFGLAGVVLVIVVAAKVISKTRDISGS